MSNKIVIKRTKSRSNLNRNITPLEQMSIDAIDRKILQVLNWNARLSYREIARQTKLSTGTVISRLNKLRKTNVINWYSVNVDAKKLGYSLTAVIEVIAEKGMFLEAAKTISKYSNVYAVYAISGPSDAILIAKFKDSDELNEFLKKLNKDKDVIRTETHLAFKTMKEDFRVII